MIIDSHIHTHYSHGDSEVYRMVENAIKKGVDGIGFAEHFHYDFFSEMGLPTVGGREVEGTVFENFKMYYKTVEKAKEDYKGKIKITLGVEVDYLEAKKEDIKEALDVKPFINDYKEKNPDRKFEFDFIMGSAHFIGDPLKYFSDYKERGEDWLISEYFSLIKDSIKSDLFDVVGHPELIKYFIDKKFVNYSSHIEEIVGLLAKHKVAVDLNTDYLRNSKTGEIEEARLNPGLEMLFLCKEKNIPLIIGSDAHSSENIAKNFSETFKILKKLGINKFFYFKNRKLNEYSII
ncbi:MAG: histidinol-phosphatase HisJ family protein [Candidatus Pacebacteria bacterium]|nr:histidinol-phosphatase HisJ family protein [Candidatus Paceibacterota bacterium]